VKDAAKANHAANDARVIEATTVLERAVGGMKGRATKVGVSEANATRIAIAVRNDNRRELRRIES
jgi:hypothetical protein